MNQLPLIRSPKYASFYRHMVSVWGMQPREVETMIEQNHKHLLDPNYKGHSRSGKPCKSLKLSEKHHARK
jgi:hypothetical protein